MSPVAAQPDHRTLVTFQLTDRTAASRIGVIKAPALPVQLYRYYGLNYTIDLYCGMKFRHVVGFLICAVGLKFINISVSHCTVEYRYQRPEAYCGLLSLCCGPKISREICAVAYAPV